MATEWENLPDADVILRASGGEEFHAHKLILSLVSPVFRDMFSVPQPSPAESSELPIVDLSDPSEALEPFLQIIYPTRNPLINDVDTLTSVLRLADKYDAKSVLDVHKDHLPSMCSNFSPIEMYAILSACGREEEAGTAARRVSFTSLGTLDSSPLLQLITTAQYQRLMSFMTARDRRMREIVTKHHEAIAGGYPLDNDPVPRSYFTTIAGRSHSCNDDPAHRLYSTTITASLQATFEADPCVRVVEALGIVSGALLTFSPCGENCRYNIQGLREYAEGLLKDLVDMAETLPWGHSRRDYVDHDDYSDYYQGRALAGQ